MTETFFNIDWEHFFGFFLEIANSYRPKSKSYKFVSIELLEQFFMSGLESIDFTILKKEGFQCIYNLFLILNEWRHFVQILSLEPAKTVYAN